MNLKKNHLHAISYNLQLMKIKFISVIEPRTLECKLWQMSCCICTYSHATRTGLNCVVDRKPKTVIFFINIKASGKTILSILVLYLSTEYLGTFWKLNIVHLIYYWDYSINEIARIFLLHLEWFIYLWD